LCGRRSEGHAFVDGHSEPIQARIIVKDERFRLRLRLNADIGFAFMPAALRKVVDLCFSDYAHRSIHAGRNRGR
jgi:hypothetical protein